MRIAVIGGGFTGLTAAYELTKRGHKVTVFERDKVLGGLAHGFKEPGWQWPLEFAYHHIFTNDDAILRLVKELHFDDQLLIKHPITSTYIHGNIYQLDSPSSLLRFTELPLIDRIRTGAMLAAMKVNPFWQPLENFTAESVFRTLGGDRAWKILWEPLMYGKFGEYYHSVAASWLWARIKKRTPSLGYFKGGFQTLVDRLAQAIRGQGGKIYTNTSISSIGTKQRGSHSSFSIHDSAFDKVLLTIPTPIAVKLVPQLQISNFKFQIDIPHLHAQLLILETKEPILKDIYWLNVNDRSFPFLAVVAHTNMIDKKYYGGHHLTYFGNYLPPNHLYLSMTKKELLKVFLPYIKRINPQFHWSDLSDWSDLFIGYYAQPVHQLHYSSKAPKLQTPIEGLYLANMDSIYPWDRGTNYAVELGKKAAAIMLQ